MPSGPASGSTSGAEPTLILSPWDPLVPSGVPFTMLPVESVAPPTCRVESILIFNSQNGIPMYGVEATLTETSPRFKANPPIGRAVDHVVRLEILNGVKNEITRRFCYL